MAKISWGVISTAKIGREKVIPAMQQGSYCEINAISSSSIDNAKRYAGELGIPKAYGSYEELLLDDKIEAVYNPLPNHLHAELTIKALEHGKHVLCEKPLTMNFEEAENLFEKTKKFPNLKVMEAFMYRHHPQTIKAKELLKSGIIGGVKHVKAFFNYYNIDSENIRNKSDIGGGGLLDIGCYCISICRFLFDNEPKRVCATIDYDPKMKIDRLVSGILEFEKGTANISCSTQLAFSQGAEIFGTKGQMNIKVPFTPSPDEQAVIVVENETGIKEISFVPCNQYTIQGDLFSKAILEDSPVPTSLSDALANMKVIDKIKESHVKGSWVNL